MAAEAKRGRDRYVEEESPSKRPAHNTGQAGGTSQGQGRTIPGSENSDMPRKKFLVAMKKSKARNRSVEKIMLLYDWCH
ncbi:MAG: hypothetical protein CL912_13240 [Deltaproteobacteria bacterium]|nr:hypothetical protein [Deltaproteobacteria bacterium]